MKHLLSLRIFALLALFNVQCSVANAQEVNLRGNIVPNGKITITAVGDNKYQQEVTLDDSNIFLFSDKYVYFECPEQGYRSDNIRINGGTYTATFNLSTKQWSFEAHRSVSLPLNAVR